MSFETIADARGGGQYGIPLRVKTEDIIFDEAGQHLARILAQSVLMGI